MRKLLRYIKDSLPTKISLNMFCVVLVVFILANGVSMVLSRRHFHTVAMNSASETLNTAVARLELYLRSVETGVISTDLPLPELSRVLNAEKPYLHSYLMLLGHDGRYLVHPDTTRVLVSTVFDPTSGQYYSDKLTLGREMTAGNRGKMHADVAGVHSLICYEPVPGTDWSAALVIPEKDVLQEYRRLDMVVLLVVFVVLLFVFFICRRTVVQAFVPMKLLEEQARLITEGDYSTPIPPGDAGSVIGTLQNSFAHMQEVLGNHILEVNRKTEELSRRNDEVEKANADLEEALRRQSDFISNMTHQIRTPLNLIMGFSQLLLDSGADSMSPEEFRRLLLVIDHNATILSRMSLMLYDSSERGYREEVAGLRYAPVSPNEVARECIGFVNRYFPEIPVRLETSLEDSFTMVSDHLYLMRCIREILYNSAKYSDGKNISLQISAHKTWVRFVFEDTGKGIPPESQQGLFAPFYKWNILSEGLGLGLSLTKRHVTMFGGTLELDPGYRKGCRFIMEIPVSSFPVPS